MKIYIIQAIKLRIHQLSTRMAAKFSTFLRRKQRYTRTTNIFLRLTLALPKNKIVFVSVYCVVSSATVNSDIVSALVSSDQVQIRRHPGSVDSNLQTQQDFGTSWRDIKNKFSKKSQQNKKYEVYSQDPVYA